MADKEGRAPEELTVEQRKYVREALRWCGIRALPRACYRTAQRLALAASDCGRIKYHEGMMMIGPRVVPVQHAWNTIDGKLFDLTREVMERRAEIRREARYFGVEVPTAEVKRIVLKTDVHYSVLEEICRERDSSVHIFCESRFVPIYQEHMEKMGWQDTAVDDGGCGELISTFEEFLEAVEDYARRRHAIDKIRFSPKGE